MDIIGSLAGKGYLLYRNGRPENTAGNVAIDVNADGKIQKQEIISDLNDDKTIATAELLDFVVNNVTSLPLIVNITRSIQSAENIGDYFQYNKKLALLTIEKARREYDIPNIVRRLSPELLDDREVVLAAVQNNGSALKYASETLRGDKELALLAIEKAIGSVGYLDLVSSLSPELLDDKEVVLAAVNRNGIVLRYASETLRGDREVVLAAVNKNGYALEYASETLRGDREIVLAAVNRNGTVLQYASETLRGDKELALLAIEKVSEYDSISNLVRSLSPELLDDRDVMLAAMNINKNGSLLKYASETLRGDKELALLAIEKAIVCVDDLVSSLSPELRNNREVILAAVSKDGYALKYASETLRGDKELALLAIEKSATTPLLTLIKSLGQELRNDREIMKLAISKNLNNIYYLSDKQINDPEFNNWLHSLSLTDDIRSYLALFGQKPSTGHIPADTVITLENYASVALALLAQGEEQKVLAAFLRLGSESVFVANGDNGWGGESGYSYYYQTIAPRNIALLRHYYALLPNPEKLRQIITADVQPVEYNANIYVHNARILTELLAETKIISQKDIARLYFEYLVLTRLGFAGEIAYQELIKIHSLPHSVEELKQNFSYQYYRSERETYTGQEVQDDF
ncbi:hypothetical protein NO2_0395 [Candidatus Termititenax persephonae]|uniref:DUF4116 domain-containing protein n=1 Tax=Candidatus Termititenax persephonae TaxID=2218525 RepID=A0A388TG76_9BACT|nr:hypothetical protein NO2_0395 [Candidatus Termititenax persephonae]